MLRFLADENFNNAVLRGLLRRDPSLQLIRVQDTALSGADDPTVLAWAAEHDCLLLTHDLTTIPDYAYERVRNGQSMPGVFAAAADLPIGIIIEE